MESDKVFVLIIAHPNRTMGGNGCPSMSFHDTRQGARDRYKFLGCPRNGVITPYQGTRLDYIRNMAEMSKQKVPEGV